MAAFLPLPPPENIALLTGPPLVGIFGNWWLYGLLCVQYYLFLVRSGNDRLCIKFVVHFIFLVDTIQCILASSDIFYWFAFNFSDVAKLYDFHLSSIDLVILDAIIAFVVQLVYCWRIWKLSEWRVIPILISFCSFVAFVSGVTVGILNFFAKQSFAVPLIYRVPVMFWLFPSAISDVAIASSMAYLLMRMKSSQVRRSTGKQIMRILTLTIETNAVTAAVAIEIVAVFLINSLVPPLTNIYLPGAFMLGKLYSNCFMVLLNQRRRDQDETTIVLSTQVYSDIGRHHAPTEIISALAFSSNPSDSVLTRLSDELASRKSTTEGRREGHLGCV